MKIRKKIYPWFLVAVALSDVLFLTMSNTRGLDQILGTTFILLVSVFPIILFTEYGLILRINRIHRFFESGTTNMAGILSHGFGEDELTDIANHMIELSTIMSEQANVIAELEDSLSFLVDDAPILVQRFDKKGIIKFVNNTYAEHFHVRKEDVIGSSIFDFVRQRGYDFDLESDLQKLTLRKPVSQGVYKRKTERGWLMWINRAIFDNFGSIKEYQVIGVDITERKEIENRLSFVYNAMTHLTSVDLSDIRAAIADLLKDYREYMNADSVRLMLFDNGNLRICEECYRVPKGFEDEKDGVLSKGTAWWSSKFSISMVDALSYDEAERIQTKDVQEVMRSEGIRKGLFVPIAFNHTHIGILSIERRSEENRRSWGDLDLMSAKVIGRLLGTILRPAVIKKGNTVIEVDKTIV